MKEDTKMLLKVLFWLIGFIFLSIALFIGAIAILYFDLKSLSNGEWALASFLTTFYIALVHTLCNVPDDKGDKYINRKIKKITGKYESIDEMMDDYDKKLEASKEDSTTKE